MTGAPYTNPMLAPPVTGRSFLRMGLALLCGLLLVLGGIVAVMKLQGKSIAATVGEKPLSTWKAQSVYPPIEEKAAAQVVAPVEDKDAQRWAEQQRMNQALLAALEDLKKRKPTTITPTTPAPDKPKAPSAPLYIANKLERPTPTAPVKEYTLAPGATKLPCVFETKIVSDVEGYFTCRVTTNVFDTATGRHLLVPQGSTILANTQSSQLVYGNERMDTVSLKLTLPDGRTVDLGRAPVIDQQGVAGLTGHVNQHYFRLLAAVLIQGVLKAGTVAVTEAAGGTVVSGLTSAGTQATTKVTAPMLNTRPTITVEAGQLSHVLLLEPLTLPAMWQ